MALRSFSNPRLNVPTYDATDVYSSSRRVDAKIQARDKQVFRENELQLNLDWTERTNAADVQRRDGNSGAAQNAYTGIITEQIKHYQELSQDPNVEEDDLLRYQIKISNLEDRLDSLSTANKLSDGGIPNELKQKFTNRNSEFDARKKLIDILYPVVTDPSGNPGKLDYQVELYSSYIYGGENGGGLIDELNFYRDLASHDSEYENEVIDKQKKLNTVAQDFNDLIDFEQNPQNWVELYETDSDGNIVGSKIKRVEDATDQQITTTKDPFTGEVVDSVQWSSSDYKELPGNPGKFVKLQSRTVNGEKEKYVNIGGQQLTYNSDADILTTSIDNTPSGSVWSRIANHYRSAPEVAATPVTVDWTALNRAKPFADKSFVRNTDNGSLFYIDKNYKVPVTDMDSAKQLGYDESLVIPSVPDWINAIPEDPNKQRYDELLQQFNEPAPSVLPENTQPVVAQPWQGAGQQQDQAPQPTPALLPRPASESRAPFKPASTGKDLVGATISRFLGGF